MTQKIVALELEIEDPNTGAIASYHRLSNYTVNLQYNTTQMVFATYVSERTFQSGRQPVSYGVSLNVSAIPPDDVDVKTWLYQHACAAAEEDNPDPSPLAGAEAVYEGSQQ